MGWVLIILGLIIALTATALLILGKIGAGLTIIIGALGIGLIAISGRWLPKEAKRKHPTKRLKVVGPRGGACPPDGEPCGLLLRSPLKRTSHLSERFFCSRGVHPTQISV